MITAENAPYVLIGITIISFALLALAAGIYFNISKGDK